MRFARRHQVSSCLASAGDSAHPSSAGEVLHPLRAHTHTHVLRPTQPHLSQDTRAQPPCLPIFPVAVELIPASPHLPPLLKPAFPAATHPDRPHSTSFFLPGAFTRAGTNSHGCPRESSQTRVSPRPCDTTGTHLWKSPPLGLLPAAPGTQIWV